MTTAAILIQQSQDHLANPTPTQFPPWTCENNDNDPENILFDSLQTLYDYQPITLTSAGSLYTYTHPTSVTSNPITITLQTPDPETANWSLHASSVWIASTQLASNAKFLRLDERLHRIRQNGDHDRKLKVLELGAAAGLPSILIAKLYPDFMVFATDYPDTQIIQTLTQNIERNGVKANCCAAPYAWGSDPAPLLNFVNNPAPDKDTGFDVILAADTLWNPDLHNTFISTLQKTLRKDSEARVHLVAGLHTGRYTIDSFLRAVEKAGFDVIRIVEQEVIHDEGGCEIVARMREWDVTRAEYEEEKDRRGWVIWIELCWVSRFPKT